MRQVPGIFHFCAGLAAHDAARIGQEELGKDNSPAPYRELVLQPSNLPLNKFVCSPDDQSAQKIQGGIHEGSDEREGGGREGGDDFGDEEYDIRDYVDLKMISRAHHNGITRINVR